MKNKQPFFNGRALFWGFGISNIMLFAKNGFWISIILGTIIGSLILLFLKKQNDSKIVKVISGFVLASLSGMILVNMASTLYLRNTPILILVILPVVGAIIMSSTRSKAFTRSLYFIFISSLITFSLGSIILIPQVTMDNLLPMSYSVSGIIKGTWIYVMTSTVPVIMLNDTSDKKNVIKNYLLSSLSILICSFLIVSVMGQKEAILYRYPEYIVLKRIRIFEFFSNVDNLFVGVLAADLLIMMASGLKNTGIDGKYTKYIIPALLTYLLFIVCSRNTLIIWFFENFTFILFAILLLTLIPKKRLNK